MNVIVYFQPVHKISHSLARAAVVADDVVIASTPMLLTALAAPVIAARAHGATVVSRCARAVTTARAKLGVRAFIVYRMMSLYGQRCLYYDCQAYM